MIIINEENENSIKSGIIIDKSAKVCKWSYMMGRPVCEGPHEDGTWWSALDDYPKGGGYVDHTPWLVFKMHVQEKHGLVVKVHKK